MKTKNLNSNHRSQPFFFFISLALFATTNSFAKDDCHKIRAAFDLGSSTFKMKVAHVNVCTQVVEKVLLSESVKTAFKDAVVDGMISEEALQRGQAAVVDLLGKAKNAGATEYYGVGTQVFRDVKNSVQFLDSLPTELSVRLITQKEEAILGYAAAASALADGDSSIVVWDIGGGSMQITTRDGRDHFITYQGQIASNAAREIAKKDPAKTSPNPIGASESSAIEEQIVSIASQEFNVSAEAKRLLTLIPGHRIIGIGGVHNQSVLNQVNAVNSKSTRIYTLGELHTTISVQATKTDAEVGGKYPDTDVSNLLLVSGFMRTMGVNQVEAVDANLADGLLVSGLSLLSM